MRRIPPSMHLRRGAVSCNPAHVVSPPWNSWAAPTRLAEAARQINPSPIGIYGKDYRSDRRTGLRRRTSCQEALNCKAAVECDKHLVAAAVYVPTILMPTRKLPR